MKYDGKAPLNSASANRKAQAVCRQLKEEGVPEWELRDAFKRIVEQDESLKELEYPDGNITEDWICVDCGTNTAPGLLARIIHGGVDFLEVSGD